MTSALIAGFSDGITLVKADILGMIIIVIPIALVIFGIMWAIKSSNPCTLLTETGRGGRI